MPESFLYFAYGSNMYTKRLVRRVGKVEKVAVAYVLGRRLSFDKISDDGSAKCDCAPSKDKDERVYGAVFRIDGGRRADLDRAEGLGRGYFADYITVYSAQKEDEKKELLAHAECASIPNVLIYGAENKYKDDSILPYHWYKQLVVLGAKEHRLPAEYVKRIECVTTKPNAPAVGHRRESLARLAEKAAHTEDTGQDQQPVLGGNSETTGDPKQSTSLAAPEQQQTLSAAAMDSTGAATDNQNSRGPGAAEPKADSQVTKLGAEDCLTGAQMQKLRERARSISLSDEIAEELSASLGLGQEIRARNLYIDDAAARLNLIVDWLLANRPQLILAREERRRLQIECYRKSGGFTGLLAHLSAGTPTAIVITALCASAGVWICFITAMHALAQGVVKLQLHLFGIAPISVESAFPADQFFMDGRSLQVIVTAAFLGGVVSIATRLREFIRVRDLDPFSMFWTAMLKPLIGVVLSIFLFATLAGGLISFGFLPADPFSLAATDAASRHAVAERTLYVLWVLGFLAGFSERFAWDFVDRAQGVASGGPGKGDPG